MRLEEVERVCFRLEGNASRVDTLQSTESHNTTLCGAVLHCWLHDDHALHIDTKHALEYKLQPNTMHSIAHHTTPHHNPALRSTVQWSISIIQSSLTSSRLATGRSLTINTCPLWVQTALRCTAMDCHALHLLCALHYASTHCTPAHITTLPFTIYHNTAHHNAHRIFSLPICQYILLSFCLSASSSSERPTSADICHRLFHAIWPYDIYLIWHNCCYLYSLCTRKEKPWRSYSCLSLSFSIIIIMPSKSKSKSGCISVAAPVLDGISSGGPVKKRSKSAFSNNAT